MYCNFVTLQSIIFKGRNFKRDSVTPEFLEKCFIHKSVFFLFKTFCSFVYTGEYFLEPFLVPRRRQRQRRNFFVTSDGDASGNFSPMTLIMAIKNSAISPLVL